MATQFYIESGTGRMVTDPSQFLPGHSYTSSGTGQVVQGLAAPQTTTTQPTPTTTQQTYTPTLAPSTATQVSPAATSAPSAPTNSGGVNLTPVGGNGSQVDPKAIPISNFAGYNLPNNGMFAYNGVAYQVGNGYVIPSPNYPTSGLAPLSSFYDGKSNISNANPLAGLPTVSLQPGQTGAQVQQLQQWLVANGLMTQADMNTGPGTYGPKTQAAVQALQQRLGVNNTSGPGYFGPQTLAAIQATYSATGNKNASTSGLTAVVLGNGQQAYIDKDGNFYDTNGNSLSGTQVAGAKAGTAPISGAASGITYTPTGDASLDAILKSITGLAGNLIGQGYTIPPGLQITPALVSQFLTYAHQAIDPYSQQLLTSRLADVNSNLSAQGTQFANSTAERIQQFGTDLAAEQNNAGATGTAFSGQRNINELNLQNTANRDLSTLGANAAYNIGATARAGAADVGAANAGGIALPSLAGGSVSLTGGQRGSSSTGAGLNYNYTPSIYTVGNIPSAQTGAVNQQQQNYLSQFGTLAGAQSNSGRSVSDLIGMMSGLPAGYTVPSNLK